MIHLLAAACLLTNLSLVMLAQSSDCQPYVITHYSVEDFPGTTNDGTPTRGNVGVIAAGSYNLPLGTYVWIEGYGTRRIADRGRLGSRHIDILVQTHREAIQLGRLERLVCRV